jgi:predicted nucleic acid-binding OB-fold protein
MKKITEEEKELLIQKRIEKINNDRGHALDLFRIYYKESPKENLKCWYMISEQKKRDIVKKIIKEEDRGFLKFCVKQHPINIIKQLELLKNLKDQQLREWGIRK